MSFELTSFDSLKKALKLDKNTLQEYPDLSVLKSSVEAAIENFLGRSLESAARTQSVFASKFGTRMIALDGLPVSSVATITLTDSYGNTQDLTEQQDFRITPYGIKLFSLVKEIDVSVTYTGGYAEGAVPADISRAALLQTIYEYQKSPNLGAETVQTEGGTTTYPELGLLKHVKEILRPHIHPLKLGI